MQKFKEKLKNTPDINVFKNDEITLIIHDSKSNPIKSRKLDLYIKLKNKLEFCLEFDSAWHKKIKKEDLLREIEILTEKPNLFFLRLQESDYLKNKEKVKNDILSIIKLLEKGIIDYKNIPYYLYPLSKQNQFYLGNKLLHNL